jgi:hypothetical protein
MTERSLQVPPSCGDLIVRFFQAREQFFGDARAVAPGKPQCFDEHVVGRYHDQSSTR